MGYERSSRYYRDDQDRRYGQGYRERDRDGERGYSGRSDYERGHGDRGLGERSYARPRDYDEDRGFFDRAGDEVRSWFGDEEAERRRRWDERLRDREDERRYGSSGGGFAGSGSGYGARGGYLGGSTGYASDYGAGRGAGATSNWGLGAGRDHDGWGQDPNYSQWRRRQMEELDRDYDDYRRENQSRFESDFGSWRSTRQGQRSAVRQVREHQEVVGSDGTHVGTVDHVRGDRILLTKTDKDAGGHHHSVPCSWIAEVGTEVKLNRTAEQAQAAWKDEERNDGPHNLNRAFSGTY
jgi:hypothetical protein